MNTPPRLLTALAGLALIGATASAGPCDRDRDNRRRDRHAESRHNDGFSFRISIGDSHRRGHDRHHRGSWGYSSKSHDFWYGSRSRGYSHRDSYRYSRSRQPVVVCPTPSSRRTVVIERPVVVQRPVVVEQPVVIERTTVIEQPTYAPIIRDAPVLADVRKPGDRYRAGWDALITRDAQTARAYFTDQAVRRPSDPVAKAGLAVARAADGLDDQAEWAMRRAVRADLARARGGLPGLELEAVLVEIEERYTQRSETYNDRWFMLAATRYLSGDLAGARDAAERAMRADPRDAEAKRIIDLVRSTEA